MTNDEAKTAAQAWHGQAGGELLPQLTANELAGIVNEAIETYRAGKGECLGGLPVRDQYDLKIAAFEAAEEACDNLQLMVPSHRRGAMACVAAIRELITKEVEAGALPVITPPHPNPLSLN